MKKIFGYIKGLLKIPWAIYVLIVSPFVWSKKQ